jgi:hypothetical protein
LNNDLNNDLFQRSVSVICFNDLLSRRREKRYHTPGIRVEIFARPGQGLISEEAFHEEAAIFDFRGGGFRGGGWLVK